MDTNEAKHIGAIELDHIGEDYCRYTFTNSEGEIVSVEIQGYAVHLINRLGLSLHKASFTDKL